MSRPVDRVTLTRAQLADIFGESGRRISAGEYVIPDLTRATHAERALVAADHIIELACLQAAGGLFDKTIITTHFAQRQAQRQAEVAS
jgi:hypothetical protein